MKAGEFEMIDIELDYFYGKEAEQHDRGEVDIEEVS